MTIRVAIGLLLVGVVLFLSGWLGVVHVAYGLATAMVGIGALLILASGAIGLAVLLRTGWRLGKRKQCPDCAEPVAAEANVCKHCGYRFGRSA